MRNSSKMTFTRLAMFAWALVMLQISYSDATIDPNDYYIDKSNGHRRLRINLTELSSDDRDKVRDITITGKDAPRYCKFAGISPYTQWWNPFALVTDQPAYWCFDERDNVSNICCEDEGECYCSEKNRYNCYCSGTLSLIRSEDEESLELEVSLNFTETALITSEDDKTLKLEVLANFTETAQIADT